MESTIALRVTMSRLCVIKTTKGCRLSGVKKMAKQWRKSRINFLDTQKGIINEHSSTSSTPSLKTNCSSSKQKKVNKARNQVVFWNKFSCLAWRKAGNIMLFFPDLRRHWHRRFGLEKIMIWFDKKCTIKKQNVRKILNIVEHFFWYS